MSRTRSGAGARHDGTPRRDRRAARRRAALGAALGVGLLLLVLLTLLGLAGMSAALAALSMAGNDRHQRQAFDAAEAGIARALRGAASAPGAMGGWPAAPVDGDWLPRVEVAVVVTPLPCPPPCAPPEGFSLDAGGESLRARYFTITATGSAPPARAVHEQVAYVLANAD